MQSSPSAAIDLVNQLCTATGQSKGEVMKLVSGYIREQVEAQLAHEEERRELKAQRQAGVLDEGQDDYDYDAAMFNLATPEHGVSFGFNNDEGCFARLCNHMGVRVGFSESSVSDLIDEDCEKLRNSNICKIWFVYYAQDDPRNHVEPVWVSTKTFAAYVHPGVENSTWARNMGVTSAQAFFNPGSEFYKIKFYAEDDAQFGQGLSDLPQAGTHGRTTARAESIAGDDVSSGSANVNGGVVRTQRRVISGKPGLQLGRFGAKNYRTTGITMFNNVDELFLDKVSRPYAQEIIEKLFDQWNVPMQDVDAVSYAEDLLWAFLIARTASNKADFNVEYDIPVRSGEQVFASFSVFSRLLSEVYGITRRNFSRAVADDQREYLRRNENKFMLPVIAQRVGADPQMGDLCFDGSTHCTNLTSSESTFTRLLEGRNLFERDDVIAEGASGKLMQGMHGSVRSVVPR